MRHLFAIIIIAAGAAACSRQAEVTPAAMADRLPPLTPALDGTPALPRNIAPPNFRIGLDADDYQAAFGLDGEEAEIVVNSTDGAIVIPEDDWADLLDRAAGKRITLRLATRAAGADWTGYPPLAFDIDTAALTDWLVYRLIYPGGELWNRLGIYQRCPADYTQEALLENQDAEAQCLNCHNFAASDPSTMMMHVRGPKGGTIIIRPGRDPEKIKPTAEGTPYGAAYPAFHPSGRFIAFAADEIQQFFHTSGSKSTEVVNMAGDLMVYDLDTRRGFTDSLMAGPGRIETFPAWSPDGRMLYYCRAQPLYTPAGIDSARYDLMRRPFDPATGRFTGAPEPVYLASAEGLSASVPRISPDGRWLLFTRSAYGNFMIWHDDADLCLIDLAADSLAVRPADEINAPGAVDSYHSWSSDGRWMVFSSKRGNGLFARPYIARFDPATGRFSPPFILPQQSPDHYADLMRSFNVPEFVAGRVDSAPALRALATQ